jgi:NAD(P)-dependent dehydrogenase (short-subunit alcohol dehydrogenase family)
MRLAGRAVVLTGASSGIGRASALRFAREGARVLLASHLEAPCVEVVREIEREGGVASFQHTDVSRRADTERAIDVCVERYGSIDILFCNAGITLPKLLTDTTDDEIDRVLA